jgi:hypothetical protein
MALEEFGAAGRLNYLETGQQSNRTYEPVATLVAPHARVYMHIIRHRNFGLPRSSRTR